jgi:hypothetical protein
MQKVAGLGQHWTWQYYKSAESSDQRASATTSLDHPTPRVSSTDAAKRPDPYLPRRRSAEIRTGSRTACTVNTSSTPAPARHRTCTPNPCQLASKILCGSSRAAMPARAGQGRSFRNGVRFSVQTRSAGSVAWRRLCLYGAGNRGRSPVGGKARIGEVVCSVCIWPSDAQNKPESEF